MIASFQSVEVDYPGRGRALGPVGLTVAPAERIALVGPSGCGKSTALRLLAGLEAPTRGRVARQVDRGQTAVVFQAPTLAPWLDAAANVALPLELSGTPRAAARAKAMEALEHVGLRDAAAARPCELSGGMAMRVSLARALAVQPRLLLLDEPFAALDEITRRALAEDVLALQAKLKPAMVFVTHSVEEAVYMAERVIVLSGAPGRIVGETRLPGGWPHPAGWRSCAEFRQAVECISDQLADAMRAA